MTERLHAPWTEQQVAALNAFQRSGVMRPFTCEMPHRLHQTLIAEPDGWHCPDEQCDYRQTWAHAFMAEPLDGLVVWSRRGEAPRPDPMAAELKRVRRQLRDTEDELAQARRHIEELTSRREAVRIHEAIVRIPAQPPDPAEACGEYLYERPIRDVPTGGVL